jgi:hypothetical protein
LADHRRELRRRDAKKNLIIGLEVARNADLFRCETCTWGRHCDDTKPAPIAQWVIRGSFGTIESRTCFLPMITPQTHFLLRLFSHYKNAVLPYAGGLLDQPHFFAEAMEILAGRSGELDAELAERIRRDT